MESFGESGRVMEQSGAFGNVWVTFGAFGTGLLCLGEFESFWESFGAFGKVSEHFLGV